LLSKFKLTFDYYNLFQAKVVDCRSLEYNQWITKLNEKHNNNDNDELQKIIRDINQAIETSKDLEKNGKNVYFWHFNINGITLGTSSLNTDYKNNTSIEYLDENVKQWIDKTKEFHEFHSIRNQFNNNKPEEIKRWQRLLNPDSLHNLPVIDLKPIKMYLYALMIVFGKDYIINLMKIIRSDKDCQKQQLHLDYMTNCKKSVYINNNFNFNPTNNMSYSFFYNIQGGSIFHFLIDAVEKVVHCQRGDFILFPANTQHGGGAYSVDHHRIFGYFYTMYWPPNPNFVEIEVDDT